MRKIKKVNLQPIYLNYQRKSKFLGLIDYQSLIFLLVYTLLIGYIASLLPFFLEIKIYLFLFFVIPIASILIININNESAIEILFTMLRFYGQKCIFVDKKEVKSLVKEIYYKEKS